MKCKKLIYVICMCLLVSVFGGATVSAAKNTGLEYQVKTKKEEIKDGKRKRGVMS